LLHQSFGARVNINYNYIIILTTVHVMIHNIYTSAHL